MNNYYLELQDLYSTKATMENEGTTGNAYLSVINRINELENLIQVEECKQETNNEYLSLLNSVNNTIKIGNIIGILLILLLLTFIVKNIKKIFK